MMTRRSLLPRVAAWIVIAGFVFGAATLSVLGLLGWFGGSATFLVELAAGASGGFAGVFLALLLQGEIERGREETRQAQRAESFARLRRRVLLDIAGNVAGMRGIIEGPRSGLKPGSTEPFVVRTHTDLELWHSVRHAITGLADEHDEIVDFALFYGSLTKLQTLMGIHAHRVGSLVAMPAKSQGALALLEMVKRLEQEMGALALTLEAEGRRIIDASGDGEAAAISRETITGEEPAPPP